jgi:hypothetical protein
VFNLATGEGLLFGLMARDEVIRRWLILNQDPNGGPEKGRLEGKRTNKRFQFMLARL